MRSGTPITLIFAASVAFSGPLFDLAGEQEGVVFHFQPQNSAPRQRIQNQKFVR